MKEGVVNTSLLVQAYQDFFDAHHDIYGENSFRQGLFLAGVFISRIANEQQRKSKKNAGETGGGGKKAASTFIGKLNYKGIAPRQVMNLMAQIQEYLVIYNVYSESGLKGNMMDRLQGIETSRMKAEEILFYILTGISFEDYRRQKYFIDNKKQNEEESEE